MFDRRDDTNDTTAVPQPHASSLSILPGDFGLVINFQHAQKPPAAYRDWDDIPFTRLVRIPEATSPELAEKLRVVPLDHESAAAWQEAVEQIDTGLIDLASARPGRVHVFVSAPYPLAALVGQRLELLLQQTPIIVYQFDARPGVRDWVPYFGPDRLEADAADVVGSGPGSGVPALAARPGDLEGLTASREVPRYFAPDLLRLDGTGDRGIGLSIEVGRKADEALLRRTAAFNRLVTIYRLVPAGELAVQGAAQARVAVAQIAKHLRTIRDRWPDRPIHLMTSAPASFLIALGRRLSRNVYPHIIVHQYTAQGETARYDPILEIMTSKVLWSSRPLLEVFQGDGALMYRLNGRVLPAARQRPAGIGAEVRRATSREALTEALIASGDALLPRAVEDEVVGLKALDVEIHLEHDAADLSWEFLYLKGLDALAALRRGWTLSRVLPAPMESSSTLAGGSPSRSRPVDRSSSRASEGRPSANAGALAGLPGSAPLRVLIAPVLTEAEAREAAPYLGLGALQRRLMDGGVDVRVLEPGADIEAVRRALEAFQPHVFQWIGHGHSDASDGWRTVTQAGALKRAIDRGQFRLMLRDVPPPRLVLLCGCSLGHELDEFGVPRNLLVDGTGAVIAFRDPVSVGEIGCFSETFYGSLLEGRSIRDAVSEARCALDREAMAAGLPPGAFGAPVLSCYNPQGLEPLLPPPDLEEGLRQARVAAGSGTLALLATEWPEGAGDGRRASPATAQPEEAGNERRERPGTQRTAEAENDRREGLVGPGSELPVSDDPRGSGGDGFWGAHGQRVPGPGPHTAGTRAPGGGSELPTSDDPRGSTGDGREAQPKSTPGTRTPGAGFDLPTSDDPRGSGGDG